MKKKRQYTKPIFQSIGANGTGLRISLIKNKNKGRKFDVIEVLIKHLGNNGEVKTLFFNGSPEEALELAWGLNKAVHGFLTGFEPYQKFRVKGSQITKFHKKSIWWSI